jgi:hypothetical protein
MSITRQDMIAHRTARLIEESFALTFLYDAPPDLAGLAIPLVAANAMSPSSPIGIGNAVRPARGRRT